MDQISFTQNYQFAPFLRLVFYRYATRPIWIFLYAFWLIFTFATLLEGNPFFDSNSLIFFISFLILIPLAVYRNTLALFRHHYMFQDEIQFVVSDKEISIAGSHFESKVGWEIVHYVKEYPNWMMIYLGGKQSFYYIYKPDVDPMDWEILRSIVKGRTDIPSSLKKA